VIPGRHIRNLTRNPAHKTDVEAALADGNNVGVRKERDGIRAFARRLAGCANAYVQMAPLAGGLESSMVVRVEARACGRRGSSLVFVAKKLEGPLLREGEIYRDWVALSGDAFAPRFLGLESLGDNTSLLFLEALPAGAAWPWCEHGQARRVVVRLAHLHASERPPFPRVIAEWNYERLLGHEAVCTLDFLEQIPRRFLPYDLLRTRTALRRLVLRLPRLRQELLRSPRLGPALLHGDVHSGNVSLPGGSRGEMPVFFDWARARVGSPFEDVSSWLKSLGLWEPEAARRHDTLLHAYLHERGLASSLDSELRASYWFAAACNSMAGALLYHLSTATEGLRQGRQGDFRMARHWARIVRRAAAFAA
jgi:hypothetical protein